MIKLTAAVLLPVLGVLLASCAQGAAAPARPLTRFTHAGLGFSIAFPTDWEISEGDMGAAVVAECPKKEIDHGFRANVNVVTEELPQTLSVGQYFRANMTGMKAVLVDLKRVAEGRAHINGREARWFSGSFRAGLGPIRILAYSFVAGKRGYVVTCTASPHSFPRYKARFQQAVNTFRVEGDSPSRLVHARLLPFEAGDEGMARYAANGYSIAFPTDWVLPGDEKDTDITGVSPKESPTDSFRENVNVITEDVTEGTTLDQYMRESLAGLRKDVTTGFHVVGQGKETIRGQEFEWVSHLSTMDKFSLQGLVYCTLKGKRAYVITCTDEWSTFERHKPRFLAIVRSFRLEESPAR